jgi:hypothetical protein
VVAQDPVAQAGDLEQRGHPPAPDPRREVALQRPRVGHGDRHQPAHPVGVVERDPQGEPAAPVVADDVGPVDAERVHQAQDVADPVGGGVPAGRGVAPAGAAQVDGEHPAGPGEVRDDVAPREPVLGEAVQQDHGGRVGGTGLGDVEPDPVDGEEPVVDVRDLRQRHRRSELGDSTLHDGPPVIQ